MNRTRSKKVPANLSQAHSKHFSNHTNASLNSRRASRAHDVHEKRARVWKKNTQRETLKQAFLFMPAHQIALCCVLRQLLSTFLSVRRPLCICCTSSSTPPPQPIQPDSLFFLFSSRLAVHLLPFFCLWMQYGGCSILNAKLSRKSG